QAAVVVSEQRQSSNVVGVGLKHAVSSVNRLLGIASLLIGAHQRYQRVFLHDAIGVGLQESLDGLGLGGGIGLLDGVDIRVISRRVLDLRLLSSWCCRSSRGLSCRLLDYCACNCEDQQHDY